MAAMISTTIAKLVVVLLLIIILPCVFPSSALRDAGSEAKNVADAPANVSNHRNTTSQLPGRGTDATVVIPQTVLYSINAGGSRWSWTQEDCDHNCNDQQCRILYPCLCNGQDPNRGCKVGCVCGRIPYNCDCLCNS